MTMSESKNGSAQSTLTVVERLDADEKAFDGVKEEKPNDEKELTEGVAEAKLHIVGGSTPRGMMLGKRRKDEEDSWPAENDFDQVGEDRESVEKAQSEQQSTDGEGEDLITAPTLLNPPLPLQTLVSAFEESNSLRQNVDAMQTNVDGFGHTFVPVIPLKAVAFKESLRDLMEEDGDEISEEALDARSKEVMREAAAERRRLKRFFDYAADESFIEFRRNSREDLEVLGNWSWEVLRDKNNKVRHLVRVPFFTIRLTKRGEAIPVTVKRKVHEFKYEEFETTKRFRRFVQQVGNTIIWFKEFGDPRVMSKKSGRYYRDIDTFKAETENDPKDGEASEILHYRIHAVRGAYRQPRWIGNLTSVLGSRQAEEVNLFYFKNKAIPPMIIFVENGRLGDGAVERLADFMEQVKGDTEKFWKVAILEGESSEDARRRGVSWTGQPRFKIERLSSEQLKDALFQEYDERNRDKVGESFRIPRLLRGDSRDFNRATALTAKSITEEQVFEPERDRFDSWLNRKLGPELDMKYWLFKSRSPIVRDPKSLSEMVRDLVKVGVLTPNEGRQLSGDIFNTEFEPIEEKWANRPLVLTISTGAQAAIDEPGKILDTDQKQEVRGLLGLGKVGDPIDSQEAIARLLEIRDVLKMQKISPPVEGGD